MAPVMAIFKKLYWKSTKEEEEEEEDYLVPPISM